MRMRCVCVRTCVRARVCVTQILHIKGLVSAEDIWQDEPEDQVNSAYVKTWVIVAVTA